jgi:hypothetical protein
MPPSAPTWRVIIIVGKRSGDHPIYIQAVSSGVRLRAVRRMPAARCGKPLQETAFLRKFTLRYWQPKEIFTQ